MSRQSCLSLCCNRVNPPLRQSSKKWVSMSRHSVLCRDSGESTASQPSYVHVRNRPDRTCTRVTNRAGRAGQCGSVLRSDREGHERATDQARNAHSRQTRQGGHNKAKEPRLGARDRGILFFLNIKNLVFLKYLCKLFDTETLVKTEIVKYYIDNLYVSSSSLNLELEFRNRCRNFKKIYEPSIYKRRN